MNDFVPQVIESSGKTIDEAIAKGLKSLGFSIDEVSINTLQTGSKGIFGFGAKPCIVRLTQKNPILDYMRLDYVEPVEQVQPVAQKKQEEIINPEELNIKPKEVKPNTPPKYLNQKAVLDNKIININNQNTNNPNIGNINALPPKLLSNSKNTQIAPKKVINTRERTDAQINKQDKTVYLDYIRGQQSCEAAEFCSTLLEKMGIKATIKYFATDNFQRIKIESDSMGMLIGHRGETLDAMQYLTSLVVNRGKEQYLRITIDTENYRVKREETLVRLARKLASQVKSTNKKIELEPMNPYERRVLHATLQNNLFVETSSTGDEPNRRVVISPKKSKIKSQV